MPERLTQHTSIIWQVVGPVVGATGALFTAIAVIARNQNARIEHLEDTNKDNLPRTECDLGKNVIGARIDGLCAQITDVKKLIEKMDKKMDNRRADDGRI